MKNKITKLILGSIFLLVFNFLFFLICGTENSISTWISYSFIQVAYLFLLVTPFFNRKNNELAILSMTLYSISVSYFLLELLVGVTFINVQLDGYMWALLIQVILFALFLLIFLSSFLTNENTIENMKTNKYESMYIKESANQLKMILLQISDKSIYKKVERCYDLLQNSPTQSIAKVKDIEIAINANINTLRDVVSNGDQERIHQLCDAIKFGIEERNSTLKYINKNNY